MPLTDEQVLVIRDTAAAVAAHADAITRAFYPKMFAADPAVLAFFNPAHQRTGQQPRALANALVAYAMALVHGRLDALGPAVELMAVKHCALMVQPEHYEIVGRNLMGAIRDVLGEAVTPAVHDAWTAAYRQLAAILIERERQIYAEQLAQPGGWNGYRRFRVARVVDEGDDTKSFYLEPADGMPVARHQPGQYLTLRVDPAGGLSAPPTAPRNYSISSAAGAPHYRISVRRLDGGAVSGHLHTAVRPGDEGGVGPPCGAFVYRPTGRPAALVSGGIGVTPLLSMLPAALDAAPAVHWIHSHRDVRPTMTAYLPAHKALRVLTVRTPAQPRLTATAVLQAVAAPDADYYICGPRGFIADIASGLRKLGVPADRVHYEFFGPLEKVA